MAFRFYRQLNAMDCGPACLRMIARHYGRYYNADTLRKLSGFGRQGVSLLGLGRTAEKIGLRATGMRIRWEQLPDMRLPCILHWEQRHFVVLLSVKRNGKARVADPAKGILTYRREELRQHWYASPQATEGILLTLEPQPAFYHQAGEKEQSLGWGRIFRYLSGSRWAITQVLIALVVTSLLQLVVPFLTQRIIDTGIHTRNLGYVTMILLAQLMLMCSRTVVEFIRTRVLLRISNLLNFSVLSDFWRKLSRLPVSYFDVRQTGDTLQRIDDQKLIQQFLTGTALQTLFSFFSFGVFAFVLAVYNMQVFWVFVAGSILYFWWIWLFLHIRRKLNYATFEAAARENNATLQFIQGMQEIRLNNAAGAKQREWEQIQALLFRLGFRNLSYSQWQQSGALLINHGKDLLITFLVARLVIDGQLTLGTMLAVQYIIGQLGGPVEQLVGFVQHAQDARLSMERLNEVHQLEDEEPDDAEALSVLPADKTIHIRGLSFAYPGVSDDPVLNNLTLQIPAGKVTAIVGVSGSGKTTLLKLLLRFYDQYEGNVSVGQTDIRSISPSCWRQHCGAVLQDGYLFNDSIAGNITMSDGDVDWEKLHAACRTANILSFIASLPDGFNTQLGAEGLNVSQGQKQRLLIARAVYREPDYLFFDEATNALDANNERTIVENLHEVFQGRTVVVVAHRLSTVKHADNIILLHGGSIAEQGTHTELTAVRGQYFELVRNQLELGV